MHTQGGRTVTGRAEMAAVGSVAGLAIWALAEHLPDVIDHPHVYLAVTSFVAGFFAVLMGLSGPYRVVRAALPALWLSALAALLVTWAGWRFDTLEAFAEAGHPIMAWGVFVTIGAPFAAALLRDHHSLRDYGHLFDVSWSILVRYSAGWLFAGLFWAVLFMSHALLEIVGLTIIEDILDIDGVPFVVTGFALGLGLSVVHEMREYLSPFLVLRLLRLLVPVVLAVVLIFVVAALSQDPSTLFGSLSRTAVLLFVGLAMICLVSISLDRGDADAVRSRWMRLCTAALALLLPVIAGLAIYALSLRVAQYGWTPARLAAAATAAIVALYALTYAVAVVLRGPWMARIRQANILVAVVVLLTAAAWQSPLLNAEQISSKSQVVRIESGNVPLPDMALYELAHDWGKPGRAGIAQLQDGAAQTDAALQAQVTKALSADSRWQFERGQADRRSETQAAEIHAHLTVLPQTAAVTEEMLEDWPSYRLREWSKSCVNSPDPGCVLLLDQFAPEQGAQQGVLFIPAENRKFDVFSVFVDGRDLVIGERLAPFGGKVVTVTEVRSILEGRYEVAPSSRRSLWIGDVELFPEF
ncbi:MAG: DUF4153 domain-containing protein [Shimia sp.]|uniref:DUF4153 domain-containing protein n=1 Tax=Shimia sp. TaxID=1954381 RepID=UPI0025D980E2|nr:DUF4153 domain-containing protein [Shimia sp.]MCH2068828.1 DUF4153 domain-containing protein [Shimia sp.]